MKYPKEFVLKVNEIYHDVEGSEYEDRHPEIYKRESARWQKVGRMFIADNPGKVRLLDIGSGAGFVPEQIGGFLKSEDLFVCSDIAAHILDICKNNISGKKFKCRFEYLKLDGNRIDLESDSFDHITLNSVLHHIPDLAALFKEIDRLLKTNGRLIIGHEPNKPFYTHGFLWNNYRFISCLFHPEQFTKAILRRLKVSEKSPDRGDGSRDSMVEEVNRRLLEEGVIKTPLTPEEMCEVVDIHSPTAGGYHKDRGIDVSEILRDHLPAFEIEYMETYAHLCKLSSENGFTRWYDSVLKKIFPATGSTFLVVLKKTAF